MVPLDPCYCSSDFQIVSEGRRRGCEHIKSGHCIGKITKIYFANFDSVASLYEVDSTCASVRIITIRLLTVLRLFVTLWTDCSMPGILSFTISWSLLKFMSFESVMLSNHLILCHLLLLPAKCPKEYFLRFTKFLGFWDHFIILKVYISIKNKTRKQLKNIRIF